MQSLPKGQTINETTGTVQMGHGARLPSKSATPASRFASSLPMVKIMFGQSILKAVRRAIPAIAKTLEASSSSPIGARHGMKSDFTTS
jgi:hypothetical protein